MKAIRPITKEERKAMNNEIRRQCVEMCKAFELDYDTMIIFVLHNTFGFGEKRIKRLMQEIVKSRAELKDFYCSEKYHDDTHFFAMREWLKKDGIDVEAISEEIMKGVD